MSDTPQTPGDDPSPPQPGAEIIELPLASILSEKYLAYSVSAIGRTLPDVRDGLKPVHRRVLYAMTQLRLGAGTSPKKSARVVGDVIGKFHPHGDTAVYDALVRLAQDFAQRYPLVDGQGNFGNIDGDNAAAMRYTEARLTAYAEALLQGLGEDAVDFRPTYDGDSDEPVVLPAAVPNLLANGATGIAVGMATNIPPHNVEEVCNALIHLIQHPDASVADLVDHMPGPDLPTGGILTEDRQTIIDCYEKGRGSLRVRARWEVEKLSGGQWQIVVTEIPYQVQKSRLIERIAEAIDARKVPLLDDVREESAEDIRLVLVPKSRNVDPDQLMESLFRVTDLESRFALNMNVLDEGVVPRVMTLKEVAQAYLDHRLIVLQRRTRYRLSKIAHRLEVLAGYLIAYLNLDEVIAIIRRADDPKADLMARFDLSQVQAEAILALRLRQLNKLEELEIQRENEALSAEQASLQALMNDSSLQWAALTEELEKVRETFGKNSEGGARRTTITASPKTVDINPEAVIEKEPVTVLISQLGWIKALKGHAADVGDVRYKDGDAEKFVMRVTTIDKLLLLASDGRLYTLGCDGLPPGRGFGEPLRLSLSLEAGVDIVAVLPFQPGQPLMVVSSDGRGFRLTADQALSQTKAGKQVLNVGAGVTAARLIPAEGDHVAIIGTNRKLLVFPLDQVPEMTRGKGVGLQKYKEATLADLKVFTAAEGLSYAYGAGTRTLGDMDLRGYLGNRNAVGRQPPTGFPRANRFEG